MGASSVTLVPNDRAGSGTVALSITRVNPLEHGDEIKQLFAAHARPEFSAFFDRAYRDAVAAGATSWIGRDEHDHLRAHIVQFPRQFLFRGRVTHGSLLGNLMIATAYRSFWPGLALARRMVRDSRESGSIDFLYADPNQPAEAILHAVGFRPVGALQRFVLPVSDTRWGIDLGLRLYHLIRRLRARPTRIGLAERGASEPPEVLPAVPAGDKRSLRPIRDATLYRGRLAGYGGAGDRWYTFHATGSPEVTVGKALVRGPDRSGRTVVCVLQCEPMPLMRAVLVSLAQRLRRTGVTRLELWVMAGSQAASEAGRAGFMPRQERIPVVALPLSALGAEAIAAGSEWHLLPLDLDR